jgi:hypothetical protein
MNPRSTYPKFNREYSNLEESQKCRQYTTMCFFTNIIQALSKPNIRKTPAMDAMRRQ